ncbi:hypothetical protein MPER_13250 [Moniliophthora perniciosa FA553]|nr:hypothetical protein MPER_13250 [Moniliophthora perniciosa FA553]
MRTSQNALQEKEKGPSMPLKRREWWEEWEEQDRLRRRITYDPNHPLPDRVHSATNDFNNNRKWPPNITGVRGLWDQFQIFAGLLTGGQGRGRGRGGANHRGGVEKDDVLINFLNSFAKRIQVFLSSYMRRQGLLYSDAKLHNVPRLVSAWLGYLEKHHVFTEAEQLGALEAAERAARKAQEELPLTGKLAKALPDDLNSGFSTCFGVGRQKGDHVWPDVETKDMEPNAGKENDKKRKRNNSLDIDARQSKNIKFTTELAKTGGWGNDSSAGSSSAGGGWAGNDPWAGDLAAAAGNLDQWHIQQPSLWPLLGPTALPLTHDTGIVEWSVRRVASITPSVGTTTLKVKSHSGVEAELAAKFCQVELAPWLNWDDGVREDGGVLPRIIGNSKGKVVVEKAGEVMIEGDASHTVSVVDKPQAGAHNPLTDNITILLQPSGVEHLREGMGLGGTWVQLVRNGETKKKKNEDGNFWYMDNLTITLTSYHTI